MSEKVYTYEEVASHNGADSLWVVIQGKVYDASKFREDHPGGEEVLLHEAGKDATEAFEDVGHSDEALGILKTLCIGEIKEGSSVPKPNPVETPHPKASEPETSNWSGYALGVAVAIAFFAYKYATMTEGDS